MKKLILSILNILCFSFFHFVKVLKFARGDYCLSLTQESKYLCQIHRKNLILARNMPKHQPKLYHWRKSPHPLMEVGDGWFVWLHSCVTWFWMVLPTGCSLSDQHILSPIKPKYNDWFCQIYKDLHKLFGNSKHKFCKFWISNNLCKSL